MATDCVTTFCSNLEPFDCHNAVDRAFLSLIDELNATAILYEPELRLTCELSGDIRETRIP